MKSKYFILTGLAFIAGLVFTGCNNNSENKVEDAREEVHQANQELKEARAEYDKEWQLFKTEAELKINAIKSKIEEFKVAMKTMDTIFKTKFENELLTMEQKQIELQKKLNEYHYEGKDNWREFKKGFNDDVDIVENALEDIFDAKN